ncbi:capsular biosynthesis protein [Amphibacillus sp. MSJ-3]|uniref:YveK family protein n=1 Tax=Amphibacillus sp. MSJ-3 TaxID=2841505 RepID=UPI001C0EB6AF|nr:Wzz/FepE/Etk N-terminal domain-containing protein [Amphibacillus sp. MSJ-3]MBU5594384.1 capsular biosynthesis protein [Amphibacillus sp. MSJ-3]
MDETITITEIAQIIRKRLGLILGLTFGAALISGLFTLFFITPTYQADSQFLVNQNQSQVDSTAELNDIRTNIELINTYSVIIKSNRVLDEVIDELNLAMTSGTLSEKLSVSNENNSQVVTVSATDSDPEMAVEIANTTVNVFKNQIGELMNKDNVNILNAAELPDDPTPVSPNTLLNVAIAFVLGAMVGIGLAFLLEFIDTSIKTEADIDHTLGIPVIGIVSKISEKDLLNTQNPSMVRINRGGARYDDQAKKTS